MSWHGSFCEKEKVKNLEDDSVAFILDQLWSPSPLPQLFWLALLISYSSFILKKEKKKRFRIESPRRGVVSIGLNSVGSAKMVQMFAFETLDT